MPTAQPGHPTQSGASSYAGKTIARCKVGERLGRGATSHVFRAFYEPLNKDIALKILAKEAAGSEEMRKRFLSEARAVGKLNHENIVKVLDVVEDQRFLCILMELVNGPTLQDRLDDEAVIPPRHAFRIAGQIARALESAHESKVVHRDVKPANVILTGRPGEETVKVVDFGLAAQQEMNRVGTPLFMSPEAAQGKRIDEKSDVYALGICLYRMLTGVLPFTGATVKDILAAQVNAEMVPPSERRPQLTKAYDDLLKKLLVKSKGYRPSAGDAADMLEDIADDLEERDVGVRRVRKRKRAMRKKSTPVNPAVWTAMAVVGVVVVIAAWLLSGDKPQSTTPPAPQQQVTPVIEPAQKEYDDTFRWFTTTSGVSPAEAARRWKSIETKYPGTVWAAKAAVERAAQEKLVEEQKKKAEDEGPTARPAPAPVQKDPRMLVLNAEEDVKKFKFKDAASVLEDNDPPEGRDEYLWNLHVERVALLGRKFTDKMNAGFAEWAKRKGGAIKAKGLFPDAKDTETIIGANNDGAMVSDGNATRTILWTKAPPEAFFKRGVIKDKVLSAEDFDSVLVLASLAEELKQTESAKRLLQDARTVAGDDPMRKSQVEKLFGK